MNALMWGKQQLNNMADKNPKGTVAKLFGNADQSSEKIAERNKKTVHLIAESIEPGNYKNFETDPEDAKKLKAAINKTEALINGAGTDPMAVYREIKKEGKFEKGMALIYQNMPKS